MANRIRTRRHRRRAKAILAHGKKSVARHALKTGRTGQVHVRRLRSCRRRQKGEPGLPANVAHVRIIE